MDNTNLQQPHSMVTFSDKKEKDYLVIILGTNEDGNEFRDWEWITGRQAVYDFVKGLVESEQVDLFQSKVISEGQPIEKGLSFVVFMKNVIELDLIVDPGFDIMDYVTGEEPEGDE